MSRKKREVDPDAKPYLIFRYCKEQCFACPQCGYFWGPGHDKWQGLPATWPASNGFGGSHG